MLEARSHWHWHWQSVNKPSSESSAQPTVCPYSMWEGVMQSSVFLPALNDVVFFLASLPPLSMSQSSPRQISKLPPLRLSLGLRECYGSTTGSLSFDLLFDPTPSLHEEEKRSTRGPVEHLLFIGRGPSMNLI